MNKDCDIVRDLLPLYVDGVCSEGSRRLVDGHVAVCPACAKTLSRLRDSACEDSLRRETAVVLAPRKWRNRAFAVSCALAAFLCVPACLLAALGAGRTPDWLYLPSPSLLVVMAATMLPLRSRRYTGRWTMLGYTASLLLLLLACWVYTAEGGVERYLFAAGTVILYVLSAALILPWAVKELPLPGRFGENRRLAHVAWDGFFALLIGVALCLTAPASAPAALVLGGVLLLALTAAAAVCLWRRLPMAKPARAGLCVTLVGNALCWLERPVLRLAGAQAATAAKCHTAALILLTLSMAAGLALVAAGVWRAYSRVKKTP